MNPKREARKGQRRYSEKVSKVMGEWKAGTLHSSSGEKITDRKQAIAVALSEARREKKA